MKIIGIGGQKQNGKDTIADELAKSFNEIEESWKRISFAKKVKAIAGDAFGLTPEFIEEWKVKDEIPPGLEMPMRAILQMIGDGFRAAQGTIWIDHALKDLEAPSICSDVRYINELRRIHESGGLNVVVWRPDRENNDSNGSEAQIKPVVNFFKDQHMEGSTRISPFLSRNAPYGVDYVDAFIINDGSLDELQNKAREIVLPLARNHFDGSY